MDRSGPVLFGFTGEQLLQAGQVFCLRPIQLYSVSQQLRLAKPTCFNGDARTDLGHILDFTCRLRYLKVTPPPLTYSVTHHALQWLTLFLVGDQVCGSRGPVGTSNIQESSLPFDLSVFKSLQQIEVICSISCLHVSPCVATYLLISPPVSFYLLLFPCISTCLDLLPHNSTCLYLCPRVSTFFLLPPCVFTCLHLSPCIAICVHWSLSVFSYLLVCTCLLVIPPVSSYLHLFPCIATCTLLSPCIATCVLLCPPVFTCLHLSSDQ